LVENEVYNINLILSDKSVILVKATAKKIMPIKM